MKSLDLTGKVFGQLAVLRKSGNRHKHKNAILWVCKCTCGKEKEIRTESLNKGTISCGCARGSKKGDNTLGKDEFLKRSRAIHGDKYTYEKVEFVNVTDKVTITCTKHGYFSQAPRHHMDGRGCKKCAYEVVASARSSDTAEFVSKAKNLHGNKYEYSKVVYTRSWNPVTIKCNTCDSVFEQNPDVHLSGNGCTVCGHAKAGILLRGNKEAFELKATKVHGDKYDYSDVDYVTSDIKVTIKCKECEKNFTQKPNSHLSGKGCPNCPKERGFNVDKDGILYVLESEDMVKIGITNVSAESRARHVTLSANKEFSVYRAFNLCGRICVKLESKIIRELRKTNLSPTHKFDGYTECFYGISAQDLSKKVEECLEAGFE